MKDAFSEWNSDSNDSQEVQDIRTKVGRLKQRLSLINTILKNYIIYDGEKSKNNNVVDINDIVIIQICNNISSLSKSFTVQLGGVNVDLSGDVYKISIESPIGRAIFGKEIGSIVTYEVDGNTFTLKILQKNDPKLSENNDISMGSR